MIRYFYFCSLTILISCTQTYVPSGNFSLTVFEGTPINFQGDSTSDQSIIRLENGRLALKKVLLPDFKAGAEVSLKVTVRSAGDRWDKSGSCLLITDTTQVNLLQSGSEEFNYPENSRWRDKYGGVKTSKDFTPVVELMRFMTPFGVGFYSEDREDDHRKPVYIPQWAEEVEWETDISDFYQTLTSESYIGIWIDSWTKEGYEVDVEIEVKERFKQRKEIKPLANTIYYGKDQSIPGFFAEGNFDVDFELDQPLNNVTLKYITTGHGGHSGGDEFVKTVNSLYLDDKQVLDTVPWRMDCASFRRFNPSSGVWLIEDSATYIDWEAKKYKVKLIEERQASSDLSRSNWCPGSMVEPYSIELGDLTAGSHRLSIAIPAQPIKDNELNHWLISAYLVYDK